MRILEVVGLTCRVGGIPLLDALSFTVEEGEIFALCGPAGAGKTVGLRCLTGSLPFESGRLIYDGREITGTDPRERARLGLVRVGEISTPPWSLTVMGAITLARRWPRWGPLSAVVARWPGADGRARDAAAARARRARRRRAAAARRAVGGRARPARAGPGPGPVAAPAAPRRPARPPAGGRSPGRGRADRRAARRRRHVVLTEREPAVAEAVADRVATLDHGALVR